MTNQRAGRAAAAPLARLPVALWHNRLGIRGGCARLGPGRAAPGPAGPREVGGRLRGAWRSPVGWEATGAAALASGTAPSGGREVAGHGKQGAGGWEVRGGG